MSGNSELRGQLLAAIRGSWSTRPTCWDRQVDAVTAVLSERGRSEDMRVRCTCGETACESELCDCDAVPCPVNHRAEEAEAEAKRLQGELIAARECIASLEGILDELTISANEAAIAWGADVAERDALAAEVAAIRTIITEDYGTDYGDEDVPAAVERLMRHLSAAEIARGDHGRSVLDRVSDWAVDSLARGETS